MNLITKSKFMSVARAGNRRTKRDISPALINNLPKADRSLLPSNSFSYGITRRPGVVSGCHQHISWTSSEPRTEFGFDPSFHRKLRGTQKWIRRKPGPKGLNHLKTLQSGTSQSLTLQL